MLAMLGSILLSLLATATANMTGYIVGGNNASIKDWPFATFIVAFEGLEASSLCGGSLISSQTVLTAAHCLDDVTHSKLYFNLYKFTAFFGHAKFTLAPEKREAVNYYTHEKYDTDEVTYDIGIMFLDQPVKFQVNIKKALLMSPEMEKNMSRIGGLAVAGWGQISAFVMPNTPTYSEVLKSLKQTLIDRKLCKSYIGEDDLDPGIICAGMVNAPEYAYSGDSGGPLARVRDQVQAGIVSYRLSTHGITIYTSVAYYYNWIQKTQKKLYQLECGKETGLDD